ncbi:glycosyltransferase [Trichocoleus sp. FACHB-591]|uniref:glycosyltransferase n=1 Tax=Trichocoleus sp. FACHB-591 TaxID=2692872 RepID=UPI0016878B11|nr:glycosyltransferase [Trichocoleus sp. FACHB-591]MBD2093924.1 glycosyltransferase [Trichocoleus sp. FACHB-591]
MIDNSEPLVSVAVATFNGEKYLREQLDSILGQTYKNIEIVVSDDCSSDRTLDILEEYRSKYGLRYFCNERNLGLVRNFESAISMCQGKYIALCDQDDIWKPMKIETLVSEIEGYSLIYSPAVEYIHKDGYIAKVPDVASYLNWYSRFGTGKATKQLIASNWVVSHQVMFRKDLCKFALPIPKGQPYHDAWLAIVASKLGGIKFLSDDLMVYRQHEQSFTYNSYQSSGSHKNKVISYLLQKLKSINLREEVFKAEIFRLENILSFSLLDSSEKKFIADLIYCYKQNLNTGIHFRAFLISIKYMDFFIINKNNLAKIKFTIKFLIKTNLTMHW